MARFDTLDAMGDAIGEVYAECTDRILVNLARHFKYLKPGEQPGGAFQYQARKLAEFGQVKRESIQIIRDMLGSVDKELADSLERAIVDALEGIEAPLRQAAEAGLLSGGAVPPVVSPRLTEAFRLYYEQSADKLNLVNTVMLESTEEAYRATVSDITARMQRQQEILNTATGQVVTGVESFNQALRLATEKMVENGITGFVDHGGHRWRPEVYVAMDMRTTFHNVSRRAFWDRNREYANDLYLVSQHPGARPLCYPWQCRVISRTGPHRWTTDGAGNPVQVWAQDETTYGEPAGLFGINCGHHPLLFVPGVSMIPELRQDEEENAEAYALSQRQRGLERDFRKARLDMAVAKAQGDEEGLKTAREKLRRADDRLNRFEEETGRRRRREREYQPVNAKWPEQPRTPGPRTPALTPAGNTLTDGGGSGTIAMEQEIKREGEGNNIPKEYMGNYVDFSELTIDGQGIGALRSLRDIADQTGFEYGVVRSAKGQSDPFTSELPDKIEIPSEYLGQEHIELFHAHTNSTVLSSTDLSLLLRNNVDRISVITKGREVYSASIGEGWRPTIEEYKEALNIIRPDVDESLFNEPGFFDWSEEQRFYMMVREQAVRIARYFKWTLEGGAL